MARIRLNGIRKVYGTQVAVVRKDDTVHYQKIEIARDFGDHLDLVGGLRAGDRVILHPNDSIREGVKVQTLAAPAAVKD